MKTAVIVNDKLTIDLVILAFKFRWPDINVVTLDHGKGSVEVVESESPDFVILGFDIIDVDGMVVLEEIRRFSDVPIIVLSDRSESTDIIKALELGADDYLTKPYYPGILLARVFSVLRRTKRLKSQREDDQLRYGNLTVDTGTHQVFYLGKLIHLTSTEWRLFHCLLRNQGRTITFEELRDKIWNNEHVSSEEAIRTFICRLRNKLNEAGCPKRVIVGEHGIGYRFIKLQ
jgi:DNA-binding response OmpR family regulator